MGWAFEFYPDDRSNQRGDTYNSVLPLHKTRLSLQELAKSLPIEIRIKDVIGRVTYYGKSQPGFGDRISSVLVPQPLWIGE